MNRIIIKIFNLKARYFILLVIGIILISFSVITTIQIVRKPNLFESIIDYKKNALLMEYNGTEYGGVFIPNETTVYFVVNVKSLNDEFSDLFFKGDDYTAGGTYNNGEKVIRILDRNFGKDKTLMHEVAHYQYYNLLEVKLNSSTI